MPRIGRIDVPEHMYERLVHWYIPSVSENDLDYSHLQHPERNNILFGTMMDDIHQESREHEYIFEYLVGLIRSQTDNDFQSDQIVKASVDLHMIIDRAREDAKELFFDLVHDLLPSNHILRKVIEEEVEQHQQTLSDRNF